MTRAFSSRSAFHSVKGTIVKVHILTQIPNVYTCFNLQVSISAPASLPEAPKWIRMNLPWSLEKKKNCNIVTGKSQQVMKKRILTKREELSLRVVLALPKASSTGLVCTTWSSRLPYIHQRDRVNSLPPKAFQSYSTDSHQTITHWKEPSWHAQ